MEEQRISQTPYRRGGQTGWQDLAGQGVCAPKLQAVGVCELRRDEDPSESLCARLQYPPNTYRHRSCNERDLHRGRHADISRRDTGRPAGHHFSQIFCRECARLSCHSSRVPLGHRTAPRGVVSCGQGRISPPVSYELHRVCDGYGGRRIWHNCCKRKTGT